MVVMLGCSASRGSVRELPGAEPYAYDVYLPPAYVAGSAAGAADLWPMIFFLHGAGGFTAADDRVAEHARATPGFPFIVVRPRTSGGWRTDRLQAVLADVRARYRIDPRRIYGAGISMGAYGVWALAAADSTRFAAIALVAGGGVPGDACAVGTLPVRLYHNANDRVVPVTESRAMAAALQRCGGRVELTVYDGQPPGRWNHDAWTRTFADPSLYEWFVSQRRP
jgi:predicted peptidase